MIGIRTNLVSFLIRRLKVFISAQDKMPSQLNFFFDKMSSIETIRNKNEFSMKVRMDNGRMFGSVGKSLCRVYHV